MKTLFIDSSRKKLSVALLMDNNIVGLSNIESYNKHSNFLMNEIKKIFDNSDIDIKNIDNIVVLNGPGSFTGIRVGVTIAKTLAWSLNKDIYVVSNLKALTIGYIDDIVISVIYDKSNYSYVGIYENDKEIEDYINIISDIFNINNKKITICTIDNNDYVNTLKSKLSVNNNVTLKIIKDYDYVNLIKYALSKSKVNPHLVNPIYLKKIDAEKNDYKKVS